MRYVSGFLPSYSRRPPQGSTDIVELRTTIQWWRAPSHAAGSCSGDNDRATEPVRGTSPAPASTYHDTTAVFAAFEEAYAVLTFDRRPPPGSGLQSPHCRCSFGGYGDYRLWFSTYGVVTDKYHHAGQRVVN